MKKNKKGFTLAEVLITLTIIGVVAALTAPALVKNTGYAKVGPSLAKFSNTFEVATETMMSEEGINVYSADATNLAANMVMLANYINMIPYSGVTYKFSDGTGSKEYEIKSNGDYLAEVQEITDIIQGKKEDSSNKYDLNGDGRVSITDVSLLIGQRLGAGVPTVWKLKNGEVMAVMSVVSGGPLSGKGAYKGIIGEVIIDIDGDKAKNRAGKDVFAFLLDRSGTLVPVGSMVHKYLGQSGDKYATKYSDTCNTSVSDLSWNFACTGKIADNGWSANGLDIN